VAARDAGPPRHDARPGPARPGAGLGRPGGSRVGAVAGLGPAGASAAALLGGVCGAPPIAARSTGRRRRLGAAGHWQGPCAGWVRAVSALAGQPPGDWPRTPDADAVPQFRIRALKTAMPQFQSALRSHGCNRAPASCRGLAGATPRGMRLAMHRILPCLHLAVAGPNFPASILCHGHWARPPAPGARPQVLLRLCCSRATHIRAAGRGGSGVQPGRACDACSRWSLAGLNRRRAGGRSSCSCSAA
jgi:hypothetical protein